MKRKNTRGLTLIELIIAMGIAALVILAGFSVMRMGFLSYQSNVTISTGQSSLREATLRITKQVHNAPAGTVSVTGSTTLVANGKTYTVTGGKLTENGTAVANNISAMSVSISSNVLTLVLTGPDGQSLDTKLYIK